MPYTYEHPHPAVSTDAIVFTVRDGRLEVLLIQRKHEPFKDMWAFPGGFLDYGEDLGECAQRELEEETGVRGVKLEQFYAAGKPGRDPRERNISIVHVGLVPPDQIALRAGDDAADVGWFNARRPPPLAFDHKELLARARKYLAGKLMHTTAALELLPERFTFAQLESAYQAVLGKALEPRAFRRLIRSLDGLHARDDHARTGHRSEHRRAKSRRGKTWASP
jgi:8-oxo-dGTP diphosphatase